LAEVTRFTPVDQLPQFLSVEEAAIVLGLKRSHLYEMAKTGGIACIRFGRLVKIPRSAIELYAAVTR
jgi:excisionase family DNA binding protein